MALEAWTTEVAAGLGFRSFQKSRVQPSLSNHWSSSETPTQVAVRKAGRKALPRRFVTPKTWLCLCAFPRGFPAPRGQSSPSCSSADCHWKQAIFHPQGGWTQECSDTADPGSVPRLHEPPLGDLSLCQSASLGGPFASVPLHRRLLGRNECDLWQRASPQGLFKTSSATCWRKKLPVTYTPARVTHLPEKVLCSPKQSCLENDERTYQVRSVGPASY